MRTPCRRKPKEKKKRRVCARTTSRELNYVTPRFARNQSREQTTKQKDNVGACLHYVYAALAQEYHPVCHTEHTRDRDRVSDFVQITPWISRGARGRVVEFGCTQEKQLAEFTLWGSSERRRHRGSLWFRPRLSAQALAVPLPGAPTPRRPKSERHGWTDDQKLLRRQFTPFVSQQVHWRLT